MSSPRASARAWVVIGSTAALRFEVRPASANRTGPSMSRKRHRRLGATVRFAIGDVVTVAAQIITGTANPPNTAAHIPRLRPASVEDADRAVAADLPLSPASTSCARTVHDKDRGIWQMSRSLSLVIRRN